MTALSTLQEHTLETDGTVLQVKKLIRARGGTFTARPERVFAEVLLLPFAPFSDIVQTLSNFYRLAR